MIVDVHNFGDVLVSRPAGKEVFAMAKAYIIKLMNENETISLDFKNVKVLAPAWADEFVTNLKKEYKNPIEFLNTENESVSQSLKYVSA
ncbi:MAG: STAS-like domain-containing protein [Ruminococcus sp.]|nr:STAS-like domain-containing protein [Ruminococcus sp.]